MNKKLIAKDNLEKAVMSLLNTNPFYGYFLNGCRRIYTTTEVPTCGVNITDKINLYINPDFFNGLTLNEQTGVLRHEIDHVINLHQLRGENRNKKLFNIAADIAINQYIDPTQLPKVALGMKNFEMWDIKNVKDKMHSEYYYDILKQELKDKGKIGKGDGSKTETLDDHDIWEKGEQTKEAVEKIVKDAAKSAQDKAAGQIHGSLESMLQSLFKPKINWKQELKQFIQKSLRYNKEASRKKRNRRYGIVFPGKKKEQKLRLYIAVDTSGSVSDNELTQFFSEVNDMVIKDKNLSVKVLVADAIIQDTFEYKKNSKIKIKGRGGTAYQPAIEYTTNAKEEVDGLIYFGDGDSADTPVKPKYPVLWALTRKEKNPFSFGRFTKVVVKDNE